MQSGSLEKPTPTSSRWGGFATTVWALLIAIVYVTVQTIIVVIAVLARHPNLTDDQLEQRLTAYFDDGSILALAIVGSTLIVIPILIGIVKLKRGAKISEYLAARPVEGGVIVKWVLTALALVVVFDAFKWLFGMPVIPEFVIATYESMGYTWIFFPAFILLAPLTEEAFFRGFLITGLEQTFIGPIGSVVVTAALWAVIHIQYEVYELVLLFALGCVLGMSRVLTGSIFPAVASHVTINLLAYIAVAIYV